MLDMKDNALCRRGSQSDESQQTLCMRRVRSTALWTVDGRRQSELS